MKEFHVSYMTRDESGKVEGHWVHIPARSREDAGNVALALFDESELVRNGAGTLVRVERSLRNCRH